MALTRLRSVGPPPMAVDAKFEIAEDKSVDNPEGTIDASGSDEDTLTFPAPLDHKGFPLRSGGDGEERKQP